MKTIMSAALWAALSVVALPLSSASVNALDAPSTVQLIREDFARPWKGSNCRHWGLVCWERCENPHRPFQPCYRRCLAAHGC
jgi:hypothetical protein